MPVYEYRCGSGHHFEKTEGFDAPREQSCPTCGTAARRQISLPAVIFKGPGFYSTDNRGGHGGRNGHSSESESAAAASDGQGHSHDSDGHSEGSDGGSKVEAASD